jgi:hypothetical protein
LLNQNVFVLRDTSLIRIHVSLSARVIKSMTLKRKYVLVLQDMAGSMVNVRLVKRIATLKEMKYAILFQMSTHAVATMSKLENYVCHVHKLT